MASSYVPVHIPSGTPGKPIPKDECYFDISLVCARPSQKKNYVIPRYLLVESTVELLRHPSPPRAFRSLRSPATDFTDRAPTVPGFKLVATTPAIVDRVTVDVRLAIGKAARLELYKDVVASTALTATATLAPHAIPIAAAVAKVVDQVSKVALRRVEFSFEPVLDVTLGSRGLRDGYYVFTEEQLTPAQRRSLAVDGSQVTVDGKTVATSYLVLEVNAYEDRGRDSGRGSGWHRLLSLAEDEAYSASRGVQTQFAGAFRRYNILLDGVAALLREDDSFTMSEGRRIVATSYAKYSPPLKKTAAAGPEGVAVDSLTPKDLPPLTDELSRILGVESNAEILEAARAYEDTLAALATAAEFE
jgi:hypothetical protein